MKEITKAQEEILKVLWEIEDGAVADVIDNLPNPKPAYNTVATVIKVLERKGYVSHKSYGKTHVYYPVVTKEKYSQFIFKDVFRGLFNSSLGQMMSLFVKQKDVSVSELEELKSLIDMQIKKQKK